MTLGYVCRECSPEYEEIDKYMTLHPHTSTTEDLGDIKTTACHAYSPATIYQNQNCPPAEADSDQQQYVDMRAAQ